MWVAFQLHALALVRTCMKVCNYKNPLQPTYNTLSLFSIVHTCTLPALAWKCALTRALLNILITTYSPLTCTPQFQMKYSNQINSVKQPSFFFIWWNFIKKWSSKFKWFWSFPIVGSEEKKKVVKIDTFLYLVFNV
jgi:hypothetical protein